MTRDEFRPDQNTERIRGKIEFRTQWIVLQKFRDKEADIMIKRMIVLLLAVILTMSAVSIASVSSQDIDIDNLDKEQLMFLMQAISQKLQEEESFAGEEANTAANDPSAADPAKDAEDSDQKTLQSRSGIFSAAEKQVTQVKETKKYQVYENKKLVINRLPDSMFIRKPTGEDEPEPTPDTRTLEEIHNCRPGQTYECYTDIFTGEYICSCGNG